MAFENLRDQLKEQWAELSGKIQESTAFNNLREQFESQTPPVQRAIVAGASVVAVLFLLSFPYGYWSTSTENMAFFEENRELIQGLLRASRSAKAPSPLPPPMDTGTLRGRVEAILRTNRLLPDQIGDMTDLPSPAVKDLVPAAVVQNGLAVQVKKLNLNQIISLSTQMQNIGSGTKLMGIDIVQSAGQTHYYDMIVKLVNFGLPAVADSGPDQPESAPRGRQRPAAKADEGEDEN